MKLKNLMSLCLLLIATLVAFSKEHKITVVDSDDGLPLAYATVFTHNGIITGFTDPDGNLYATTPKDYPLTIRCAGYQEAHADLEADTIRLIPSVMELSEVVVAPGERPVCHLTCYVREYNTHASATDSVMTLGEHMADFFIPVEKVKGLKHSNEINIINSRYYTHKSNSSGNDTIYMSTEFDDMFSDFVSKVALPGTLQLPEKALAKENAAWRTPGKYSDKSLFKKKGDILHMSFDSLSDYEDHIWSPNLLKVFGLTADIMERQQNLVYRISEGGKLEPQGLRAYSFSLKLNGRGKMFKWRYESETPIEIKISMEYYPIDSEFLTVKEANEMIKDKNRQIGWNTADNVPPLSPVYQNIVDTASRRP